MPPDRLPSKPKPNPYEHFSLKEEIDHLTDPEHVPIEEGREIIMARSNERNSGGKTAIFEENDTVEFSTVFPLSTLAQVVFLSPPLWEK